MEQHMYQISYLTLIVLVWKFGNFCIGVRLQYDRETNSVNPGVFGTSPKLREDRESVDWASNRIACLGPTRGYEWNGRNAARAKIKARSPRRFSVIVRFMTLDWVNLPWWIFHVAVSRYTVVYISVWPITQ